MAAVSEEAPPKATSLSLDLHSLPDRVLAVNLALIAALTLGYVAAVLARYHLGIIDASSVYVIFDLGSERSFGTWFAVAGLLVAAVLLAVITALKLHGRDRWVSHWALLALIFLAMSVDEQVTLHERFEGILDGRFHAGGLLYHTWVVPATILILAVAGYYLRFLAGLPRRTAFLFCLAGALFISGALVAESFEGWLADTNGEDSVGVAWLNLLEDPLEMLGIAVFTYALLRHLAADMRLRTEMLWSDGDN